MTTVELMENLANYLKTVVEDYGSQQKIGYVPIEVYPGYPPIRTSASENPSFIYTLVTEAEDSSDSSMSKAKVEIGFNIFDNDPKDGWRSLFNIIEHVRQAILKQRTLNGRNRMEFPVKIKIVDDQPVPQWQGIIEVLYTIGQPTEEIIYDDI